MCKAAGFKGSGKNIKPQLATDWPVRLKKQEQMRENANSKYKRLHSKENKNCRKKRSKVRDFFTRSDTTAIIT